MEQGKPPVPIDDAARRKLFDEAKAAQLLRFDNVEFISQHVTGQQFMMIRWEALNNQQVADLAWKVADGVKFDDLKKGEPLPWTRED